MKTNTNRLGAILLACGLIYSPAFALEKSELADVIAMRRLS
jgi:hypothetical protein